MATDSGQRFIRRNRPPRVHITYEDPYNAERRIELPFVMGVMSDLSGNNSSVEKPDVEARKFLEFVMRPSVQEALNRATVTIPVNERSVWTAACTVSIRTRGLCVRGSSEEPECVHAAKAKGSRPTTVRNEASRRLRMETSVRR